MYLCVAYQSSSEFAVMVTSNDVDFSFEISTVGAFGDLQIDVVSAVVNTEATDPYVPSTSTPN